MSREYGSIEQDLVAQEEEVMAMRRQLVNPRNLEVVKDYIYDQWREFGLITDSEYAKGKFLQMGENLQTLLHDVLNLRRDSDKKNLFQVLENTPDELDWLRDRFKLLSNSCYVIERSMRFHSLGKRRGSDDTASCSSSDETVVATDSRGEAAVSNSLARLGPWACSANFNGKLGQQEMEMAPLTVASVSCSG